MGQLVLDNLSLAYEQRSGAFLALSDVDLSIRDGEVIPVKRVRGNRKAFQEFVDTVKEQTQDVPGLRVGIAHADAPERMVEIEKMVRDLRPQATIEMETMLGAVIGAHAGPGTVGFFWFTDDV